MTIKDVYDYIDNASKDELQDISNAIKARGARPRILTRDIVKDDTARLAQYLPKTNTEYNGRRYGKTYAYYVEALHDFANLILQNYTIRKSPRGYPMYYGHDSVSEVNAESYRVVFHELSDTLINLMDAYDTKY